MKNRTRMLLAAVLVLAMAAGLLLWPPGREAADQADSSPQARAVAAGHARHLPPTLGSGRYQYSDPSERRFDAT